MKKRRSGVQETHHPWANPISLHLGLPLAFVHLQAWSRELGLLAIHSVRSPSRGGLTKEPGSAGGGRGRGASSLTWDGAEACLGGSVPEGSRRLHTVTCVGIRPFVSFI